MKINYTGPSVLRDVVEKSYNDAITRTGIMPTRRPNIRIDLCAQDENRYVKKGFYDYDDYCSGLDSFLEGNRREGSLIDYIDIDPCPVAMYDNETDEITCIPEPAIWAHLGLCDGIDGPLKEVLVHETAHSRLSKSAFLKIGRRLFSENTTPDKMNNEYLTHYCNFIRKNEYYPKNMSLIREGLAHAAGHRTRDFSKRIPIEIYSLNMREYEYFLTAYATFNVLLNIYQNDAVIQMAIESMDNAFYQHKDPLISLIEVACKKQENDFNYPLLLELD